jgi:mannose-1-phosphate guanylyltransferase
MKALLIAGGLGTRLRPLTYTRPKHLLPIANRAHIEHVIDLLVAHDVREVVLLTSYLAESFAAVIERAESRGVNVEVAHETEPLGTAGAIKNAADLIGDGTFFAFNGDVLSSVDLTSVLEMHKASGGRGTIVLTPVEDPSAYGVVPTDQDGRVQRFVEKPPPGTEETNLINAGIYVLEPEILEAIPAGQVVSIEREVFPELAVAGSLFGVATDAYWMDIGTPEKYLQANLDALHGTYATEAVAAPGERAVVIAETAQVDPTARLSSACIGAACIIEEDAVIEDSVLLDGVTVRRGAHVHRSTLGAGACVESDTSIDGRAVGDAETIR